MKMISHVKEYEMLKTLDQSLKVLQMFTKDKPSWGVRELAQELNINHTNIYRILDTFEKHRFLVKDPDTKKYSLGFAVWELGLAMYNNFKVRELFTPLLTDLMEKTGESVFLTTFDGLEAITLDAVEPDNKVKFTASIGSRSPLYVGATYQAILAYLPENTINQVIELGLRPYTKDTIVDPDELRKEIEIIKKQGWAKSSGEYTPDVIAIAVPLFYNKQIAGSLTVSGPIYRMNNTAIEHDLPLLKEASLKLMHIMEKYHLKLYR
jgi:DNA-binding IclR family transcriptional regulator